MNIYYSVDDFPKNVKTVVTMGTFDGVHSGHQKILSQISQIAKRKNLQSVLLTLNPHPRHVLYPEDQNLRLIDNLEEKINKLKKTNLDHLVVQKFSKQFSRIDSIHFIRDFLINKLNMCFIIVGFDHHFGKNREGTYQNLIDLSKLYGFEIREIKAHIVDQVTVSSTKIRLAIQKGDIVTANKYLSSFFSISGKIVKGKQLGTKIGFPTANISLNGEWQILPRNGVYAVIVYLKNQKHFGMLNLGVKPSFKTTSFSIEVHIFNFEGQVYNEEIKVDFVDRIRDEKKFDSIESLRKQLKKDLINSKLVMRLNI